MKTIELIMVAFFGIPLVLLLASALIKAKVRNENKEYWRSHDWTKSIPGLLISFKETRNCNRWETKIGQREGFTGAINLATSIIKSGVASNQDRKRDVTFIANPHTNTDLVATLEKARTIGEPIDGNELPTGDTRVMDAAAWARVTGYLERINVDEVLFNEYWFFVNGIKGRGYQWTDAREAFAIIDLLSDVTRVSRGQSPSNIDHKATLKRLRKYNNRIPLRKIASKPPEGSIPLSSATTSSKTGR